MGTDWIQLYDKKLSDHILGMDRQTLTHFIETNIDVLKKKEKIGSVSSSAVVFVMKRYNYSVVRIPKERERQFRAVKGNFEQGFSPEFGDYFGGLL